MGALGGKKYLRDLSKGNQKKIYNNKEHKINRLNKLNRCNSLLISVIHELNTICLTDFG